jgi:hypothetical protein
MVNIFEKENKKKPATSVGRKENVKKWLRILFEMRIQSARKDMKYCILTVVWRLDETHGQN